MKLTEDQKIVEHIGSAVSTYARDNIKVAKGMEAKCREQGSEREASYWHKDQAFDRKRRAAANRMLIELKYILRANGGDWQKIVQKALKEDEG